MASCSSTKTVKIAPQLRAKTPEELEAFRQWEAIHGKGHEDAWEEWKASGISPTMILANLVPFGLGDGEKLYPWMVPNPSRVTDRVQPDAQWRGLRRYGKNWEEGGGWFCQSLDPLTGGLATLKEKDSVDKETGETVKGEVLGSGWGCLKPSIRRTRQDPNTGKIKSQKYEHPVGCEARIFFLDVPVTDWMKICDRHELPYPDFEVTHFWEWVRQNNIEVWVTEGAKKAAALLSEGKVAVAVSGVTMGFRRTTEGLGYRLHDDFLPLLEKAREFVLCFDYDDPIQKPDTYRNVNLAAKRTGDLLASHGATVCIARLPGKEKGIDDFLVARKSQGFKQLEENLIPLESYKQLLNFDNFFKLSNPDEIYSSRRLLPINRNDDDKITGIKSAKDTGKTHQLVKLVKEHIAKGGKVIVATHRIPLTTALCSRFDIMHISTVAKAYDDGQPIEQYGLCVDSLHQAASVPFVREWFAEDANVLLIVDEAEQVLHHLLFSSTTVKNHRAEVLQNVAYLAKSAVRSKFGGILLADADLTDCSVDFFRDACGVPNVKTKIILNEYKPCDGRKAYLYPSEAALFLALKKTLAECRDRKAQGIKQRAIAIYTQAQKKRSEMSAFNLEKELKKCFPELRYLIADQRTTRTKNSEAVGFASDPDAFFSKFSDRSQNFQLPEESPYRGLNPVAWLALQRRLGSYSQLGKYLKAGIGEVFGAYEQVSLFQQEQDKLNAEYEKKLKELNKILAEKEKQRQEESKGQEPFDVVIFTPVIETGVSIDTSGYFWKQFGVVLGVNAPSSARQGIARVREGCNRHLYVTDYGLQYVGNRYLTWKSGVLKNLSKRLRQILTLTNFDGTDLSKDEKAAGYDASVAALQLYGKFGARTNYESANYRECFVYGLESEGYEIIETEELPDELRKATKRLLKANKEESYSEEVSNIVKQPRFASENDYQRSKAIELKTQDQQLREQKYEVEQRFGGFDCTEELVIADDDGYHRKLRNFYYLSGHGEEGLARDRRHLEFQGKQSQDAALYAPDFVKGTSALAWKLLEELGVRELLGERGENVFLQSSRFEEYEKVRKDKQRLKRAIKTSQEKENSRKEKLKRLREQMGGLEAHFQGLELEKQRELEKQYQQLEQQADKLENYLNQKVGVQRRRRFREKVEELVVEQQNKLVGVQEFDYDNNSEALVDFRERCLQRKEDILDYLGITVSEEVADKKDGEVLGYRPTTPIEIARSLLNVVGVKPKAYKRPKAEPGEKRERRYVFMFQHLTSHQNKRIAERWCVQEGLRQLQASSVELVEAIN